MNKISKLFITAAFAIGMVALGSAQAAGPKGGAQGQGNKAGAAKNGQAPRQGGGMRRGGMLNNPEIEKRLKLTADQKKKLEAASKTMRDSMEKARGGKDFRNMSEADRKSMGDKMRPIFEKYQAEVKKILTPAQQKEMEKIQAEQMARFRQQGGGRPPQGGAAGNKSGSAGKTNGGGKAKAGGGL